MSSVVISGSLTVSEDCGCDSVGDTSVELAGACGSLPAPVHTGLSKRTVAVTSPSWLALGEVGATRTVTHGQFLFLKTNAPISIRCTVDDGAGGDRLFIVDVDSAAPFLLAFPPAKYLKLLEVQGSATIQFLVSGQS